MYTHYTCTLYTQVQCILMYNVYTGIMYIVYTGILYTQVHYIHRCIMYTGTMCTYYVHRYIVHLPNVGRNEIYLDWHCEINK